jgi:hypothetical protein
MRNRVLTACKDGLCPVDLFAAGAQEVSQILERDSYLRFRATEGFLELLAQLEPDLEPCGMLKFEELSPDPGLAGAPWLRSPPSPSPLVLSPSRLVLYDCVLLQVYQYSWTDISTSYTIPYVNHNIVFRNVASQVVRLQATEPLQVGIVVCYCK